MLNGKSRGMWKGRQGLVVGCERNQAAREAERSAIERQLEELFAILSEVEAAIDQAGDLLRISQPTMIGKLGLRWWKLKGNGRYVEPVVVRWMPQKNGVMTPKPAARLKARENGSYALNCKETQECLDILAGLIKRRAELKKKATALARAMVALGGVSLQLNNERERLEYLKTVVVRNLLEKGYEVEAGLQADEE